MLRLEDDLVVLLPVSVLGGVEGLQRIVILLVWRVRQLVSRVERLNVRKGLGQRVEVGQIGAVALPTPSPIHSTEGKETVSRSRPSSTRLQEERPVLTRQLNAQLPLDLSQLGGAQRRLKLPPVTPRTEDLSCIRLSG